MWLALFATLVGGLAITQVLRYTLQDRPWIGIFTAVAFGFIGLTTFGWRAHRDARAPAASRDDLTRPTLLPSGRDPGAGWCSRARSATTSSS